MRGPPLDTQGLDCRVWRRFWCVYCGLVGVEKRSVVSSSAGFNRAPGNPSIFWPTKPPLTPRCAVWWPYRRRQLTLMTAERDGLQRQVEEQTRAAHQLQELVSTQHRTGSLQAGLGWRDLSWVCAADFEPTWTLFVVLVLFVVRHATFPSRAHRPHSLGCEPTGRDASGGGGVGPQRPGRGRQDAARADGASGAALQPHQPERVICAAAGESRRNGMFWSFCRGEGGKGF
eukprot:COSAG04_NODE_814_length_10091_cov_7.591873_3_plen_230_part_00